jgi:hypothetical protein
LDPMASTQTTRTPTTTRPITAYKLMFNGMTDFHINQQAEYFLERWDKNQFPGYAAQLTETNRR